MKKQKKETGRVVAVCRSSTAGLLKQPEDQILIGRYGVEGDAHAGPKRRSRRTGLIKRNDRQISVVAKEVIDDLQRRFGIAIPHGGFGENILVEGIGDLSNLSEGDQISFESGVVVEVTEQNEPCANLNVWHKRVLYEVMGKRGIVGVVKKGGTLRPGDAVALKIGRSRGRSPSAAGNNNDVI